MYACHAAATMFIIFTVGWFCLIHASCVEKRICLCNVIPGTISIYVIQVQTGKIPMHILNTDIANIQICAPNKVTNLQNEYIYYK